MTDWISPTELPDLRGVRLIALDTEIKDERLTADMGSGWPFSAGYICGVCIAYRAGNEIRSHYFPLRHPDTANFDPVQLYQWLRDLVASGVRVVTQNGVFDWGWLRTEAGISMPPGERIEELGALATIIDENRFTYGLDALCAWRGLPGKDESLLREAAIALGMKKKGEKPQAYIWQMPAAIVGPYAEQDAASTLAVFESLDPILDREGTRNAYRLECELLPMVLEMRRRGIRVDVDAAERARSSLLTKRDAVLAELSEKLGANVSMDEIAGKKWLAETFDRHNIKYPRTEKGNPSFKAGNTGWMTRHPHWLPQLIIKANRYDNAGENFVGKYILDHVVRGRIHAEIHPHRSDDGGTRSLRFSYSDPPLQLMPKHDQELTSLIRGVFLPEEGEVWASLDQSQQEFRMVAHYAAHHKLSGAQQIVERYRISPDTDFHQFVADLANLERQPAKNANFAKIFGAGVRKFAEMINKPEGEARGIIDKYDHALPFIHRLGRLAERMAQRDGYLTLYGGARRHFDEWFMRGLPWGKGALAPCSRAEAEQRIADPNHPWYRRHALQRTDTHKALNALIQGSAARHTKLWMRACWREGFVPLLQMHDALECSMSSPEQAARVAQLGADVVNLEVPMLVDVKFGRTWSDAKHTWAELRPDELKASKMDEPAQTDLSIPEFLNRTGTPIPPALLPVKEVSLFVADLAVTPIIIDAPTLVPNPPPDRSEWSTPTIAEVMPGSAEFEAVVASLSAENRAIIFPAEAPLGYAARGWPVFPVPPGTKRSYKSANLNGGARWGHTLDPDEIRRDWAHWPDAGVGIVTGAASGFFVVEADTLAAHGVDGLASIVALETTYGRLPDTLTAASPRGSIHRYFKHPGAGLKIKCSASAIAPGVDVLGDNGMIVAPPTTRPGVGIYEWVNDLPLAEAPDWLLELVKDRPHEAPNIEPEADIERIAAALAGIPNNDIGWDGWNYLAMATWRATGGSEEGFEAFVVWSAKSDKHNTETSRERWEHFFRSPPTEVGAGTLFYLADGGWRNDPRFNGADIGTTPPEADTAIEARETNDTQATSTTSPLPFINMSRWDNEEPPPRKWAVYDRIPLYQSALFSGEGAAGKSLLQLHLTFAHALGREWLQTLPEPGPAIFIDAEDDINELHRRSADILRYYDTSFAEAIRGGVHLMSLVGEDAILATTSRSGKIEPTTLYKRLLEAAGDIKPKMIGIASAANVFAGSENDRSQVQQFIGLTTRIAMLAGGAVQLISHPSLTGINTDTGLSGTTQWHNAVRARSHLKSIKPDAGEQPDTDLREIVFKKNQYGPISASIVLRYQNGLFLPLPSVASLDQAAREETAQEVFLTLLKRFRNANRKVSSMTGRGYAPEAFVHEDEAKSAGLSKVNLEAAMRELFRTETIWNEPYGKPSRPHFQIAIR